MDVKSKVLIVDDDDVILGMYKERLKAAKLEVLEARDGEKGLEVAFGEVPDLILLDLFLPKKGGLSLLEILKSNPHTMHIPVIILTAYPREEYKQKGMRNGASAFLSKSDTKPGEVVEKIKELINK